MKTNALTTVALAATMSICPLMTGCFDDDDVDYKDLTLKTEIDIDFSDDYLELCEVEVRYTTFDGIYTSETLTAGDWTQMSETTRFPATSDYEISITRKDVAPTKKTYNLKFEVDYQATAYEELKRKKIIPEQEEFVCTRSKVSAEDVDKVLEEVIVKLAALNYNITYTGGSLTTLTYTYN